MPREVQDEYPVTWLPQTIIGFEGEQLGLAVWLQNGTFDCKIVF